MIDETRTRRFCTCSEHPPHLATTADECKSEVDEASLPEPAAPPDADDDPMPLSRRFCTCSEYPPHLVVASDDDADDDEAVPQLDTAAPPVADDDPMPLSRRFCTCSEYPPHLAVASDDDADDDEAVPQPDTAAPLVAEDEPLPLSRRFCTCSELPPHLAVARDDDEADDDAPEDVEPEDVEPEDVEPEDVELGDDLSDDIETEAEDDADDVADATGTVAALEISETEVEEEESEAAASAPEDDGEESDDAASGSYKSVAKLLPDEVQQYSTFTHGDTGSEVVVTDRRVFLRGAPDAKTLFASVELNNVDSVSIVRAPQNRRSLLWGIVGIGASIGMWQALDGVGNLRLILAAVVLFVGIALLADFFFRPPDVDVVVRSRSGNELRITFPQAHSEGADRVAARILEAISHPQI